MRRAHRRALVGLIVVGVLLAGVVSLLQTPPRRPEVPRPPSAPPVGQVPVDPVDGEPVAPDAASRRPVAVIVDNYPSARPQWGLSAASRVYEALTEGGITRYLAVFSGGDADRVGPVRSARTQFLDYALELHAVLAHVGGNADALALIRETGLTDLDQLRYGSLYRRIPRRGVAFEHTVFTSTRALRAAVEERGWGDAPSPPPARWKDDAPPSARPAWQRVTIDFSGPAYRVTWVYRPASNDYQRFLGGAPDVDAATGRPLAAKSIAILAVPRLHGRTVINEDTWTFEDVGSGRAWVVQDGTVTEARWRKPSREAPITVEDRRGREIAIDRGPQWVEVIPPEVAPPRIDGAAGPSAPVGSPSGPTPAP